MNPKLKFLLASNILFVFAGNLFVPLYALFILKIGGGAELAGVLIGVQFITSSLVGLLIIKLRDRKNLDENLLKINFILRAIAWMLVAIFPLMPVFFLTQILSGVSEAIGTPAFNSLVSENLDDKNHIREWGTWELIKNPVIAVASITGGFVVALFGFRPLFIFMSGLAIISFIVYQMIQKKIASLRSQ